MAQSPKNIASFEGVSITAVLDASHRNRQHRQADRCICSRNPAAEQSRKFNWSRGPHVTRNSVDVRNRTHTPAGYR